MSKLKASKQEEELVEASRSNDDTAVLAILALGGINVDCRSTLGVTPLIAAAESGNAGTLRLLLQHHADPNMVTPSGNFPLRSAVRKSDPLAWCMHLHGAPPQPSRLHDAHLPSPPRSTLRSAITGGEGEGILELMDAGTLRHPHSDAGSLGSTLRSFPPLRSAITGGDGECILELIDAGADVNLETSRGTALTTAAGMGDTSTLTLLVREGGGLH